MKTSHQADGPGSPLLSGPGDLTAFFVNDNQARFPAAVAGACGLVLAAETGKDRTTTGSNSETGSEGQEAPFVTIRLLAKDGSLSEPLHATREQRDIIALWRGLGRDFNLPLFLRDISGAMTPIAPRAGECVFAHRYGSALSGRRPRFLARRQVPLAPFRISRKAKSTRKG